MANSNAPFGFRPAKAPAGNVFTNKYKCQNAVRFLEGDLVVLSADGYIDRANSSTAQILGAVAASDPATVSSSTVREVAVYDDPNQLFEAQCDSGAFAQTNIGERFLLGSESGSGILSAQVVDITGGASASQALQVVALSPAAGNTTGAYAKVLVKIMNHQLGDL